MDLTLLLVSVEVSLVTLTTLYKETVSQTAVCTKPHASLNTVSCSEEATQ